MERNELTVFCDIGDPNCWWECRGQDEEDGEPDAEGQEDGRPELCGPQALLHRAPEPWRRTGCGEWATGCDGARSGA